MGLQEKAISMNSSYAHRDQERKHIHLFRISEKFSFL